MDAVVAIGKNFFGHGIFAALALSLLWPPATLAIGLSPASVTVEDILRGGYAEESFKVYNTEAEQLVFSFKVEGQIKEWSSVYPQNVFTIPPRQSQTVRIVIQPPPDAANGLYQGQLALDATPEKQFSGAGAGATVRTGVNGRILVNVTDEEKYDLKVAAVESGAAEERTPVVVRINFENAGNVRARPLTKIDLRNRRGAVVKSVENSDFEVLPTRSEWLELRLPTEELLPDEYTLTASVSARGQQVFSRTLPVQILEVGSLNRKGELVEVIAPAFAGAGSFVKLEAVFKNTGTLAASAKLSGEVTLNGSVVAPVSSDELNVAPGELATLAAFFKPASSGRHVARVWVVYSRKKTGEKEAVINVTPAAGQSGMQLDATQLLAAFLALLLLAVSAYALRDRLPGVRLGGGGRQDGNKAASGGGGRQAESPEGRNKESLEGSGEAKPPGFSP